uniref:Uncharacterized protein n=1 Tax=Glossina pallidipes TaxID=7398 RepID=A0A1B0A4K5_GLOPL
MVSRTSLVSPIRSGIESSHGTKVIPAKIIISDDYVWAQMFAIEFVQSVDNGGNLQQNDTGSFTDPIWVQTIAVTSTDVTDNVGSLFCRIYFGPMEGDSLGENNRAA